MTDEHVHRTAPAAAVGIGDALLLALGGLTLRLGLTDAALFYVRPEFRPFLTVSGILLLVLALDVMWRAWRRHGPDGGRPPHTPAVAWLLLAPIGAAVLVPPTPLGAFATVLGVSAADSAPPPLPAPRDAVHLPPARDGAVPMRLGEFVLWTQLEDGRTLDGTRVRLTGFVSGTADDGFRLTRFAASCCAADARPIHVDVVDDGPAPPVDRWVEVEGVRRAGQRKAPTDAPPTLTAADVAPTSTPAVPYEF